MTNAASSTTIADPNSTGSIPDFMPSVDIPGGEMLFGGADILFGEEDLMDMYSGVGAQVAIAVTSIEGGDDDANGNPQDLDEGGAMAHLLSMPPAPQDTDSSYVSTDSSSDVGGLSAADDGLGALRPNTSFNDFTHLLPPTTTSGDVATRGTAPAPAGESTTTEDSTVAPVVLPSGDGENESEMKPETKQDEGGASSSVAPPIRKSGKPPTKTQMAGRGRKRVAAATPEIEQSQESTNPNKASSPTTAPASASVVGNETTVPIMESAVVTTASTVCAPSAATSAVSSQKVKAAPVGPTTTGAPAATSTAKRRRVTPAAGGTTKKAAAAAAARKAAAAEAVAAFAPLAQDQVAKIRQSASILAHPGGVDGGATVWKLKQKLTVKAAAVCDPLGKGKSPRSAPIAAGVPLDKVMGAAQEAIPSVPPTLSGDRPSTPVEQVAPVNVGVVTASSLTSKLAPALISPCVPKDVGKIAVTPTSCTVAIVSPPAPVIPKIDVKEGVTTVPIPTSSVETTKDATTATARVAALTSSPNWISQNGGTSGTSATASAAAAAAAAAASKRARRQNLTPDERARQNRDRNREHARNTRLRKKAYVEELKKTLTEVVAERDAALLERQFESRREGECRDVRRKVMEEFLRLRAAGGRAADEGQWNAILDSNFVLKLPVTSYRKMAGKDVESSGYEQLLRGTDQVMADAAHIAEFVCNLGRGRTEWSLENSHCRLVFECDQRRFFMDGCTAVLDWTARTIGAIHQGCTAELCFGGSMRATFVPSTNKLLSSEMSFDTGAIAAQLHSMSSLLVPKELLLSEAVVDANALLDSLDVPHFDDALLQQSVKSDLAHSVTSSEKSEGSCDEGEAGAPAKAPVTKGRGIATRRGGRKSNK